MMIVTILGFDSAFIENIKNLFSKRDDLIINELKTEKTDILIVSTRRIKSLTRAKILIIPEDQKEVGCIKADMAISCGISDRNTITLSSSVEGYEMASLQREIISINGKIIEPREIELKNICGSATEKLIICALKLVLGD